MRRALVVAALCAVPVLAQDENTRYLPYKNLSDAQNPFPYWVDNRQAAPAGIAVAAVKTAADNAWGRWNAVSCAVPKAQGQGLALPTVPTPNDPYDLFNVTPVFVTSQAEMYYSNIFGPGVAAVTLPLQYSGVVEHCDVYLNATLGVPWSAMASTPANALDVETVMLHETGHCLGLNHPNDRDSVMYATILPGQNQHTLSAFETNLLCERYPMAGAVGAPCPDGGGCAGTNKCVTQAQVTGPPVKYCTRGCPTGVGHLCELPLVCVASGVFNPSFDGACVRPDMAVT
ncbi:MAG: matrixin family metalloprotease, partial [Myxococcaceae bacterium]|nr:matrixin family metalloprotease [Myxococcaceae bacterium]